MLENIIELRNRVEAFKQSHESTTILLTLITLYIMAAAYNNIQNWNITVLNGAFRNIIVILN